MTPIEIKFILKKIKGEVKFNKKIAKQALAMAKSADVSDEEMIGFQKGYIRALTEVVDLIELHEDDDPATVETLALAKVKSMGDHLREALDK